MSNAQLYQGDCLEVMATLSDGIYDLVVTSPPYNCRKPYGNFDDQLPWPEYYAWMERVITECYRLLRTGGTLAIVVPGVIRWQRQHRYAHTWSDFDPEYPTKFEGQKEMGKGRIERLGYKLLETMERIDPHLREPIVWVKGSDGQAIAASHQMGCDSDPHCRATHEMILLGSKGRWFHRGGTGRRGEVAMPFREETKDVWHVPPISSNAHPAPFPLEIPLRLIRLFIHAPDSIIFDPFMGTGTSGAAAYQSGYEFAGIELDPEYFSMAKKKIELSKVRQLAMVGD